MTRTLGLVLLVAAAAPAVAEPYRLRADALARVPSPVGLLVLQADGQDEERRWLSAEALVWLGAGGDAEANALVVALRARDPKGRGEARVGRFVVAEGGLMPTQLDGLWGRVRLPARLFATAFAGVPVALGFGSRAYDWQVGGRVGRQLGDWGSLGLAYQETRDHGELAREELAADGGAALAAWLDLGGHVAWDVIHPGVSDAQVSAAARRGAVRLEVYGGVRSPARLLPATSLFTVLGDASAGRLGVAARWRFAPRLDLFADLGARTVGERTYGEAAGRALLRLDERGAGALGLELRREGAEGGGWSGLRGTARVPLAGELAIAVELELVRPDQADGRGALWPWALGAVSWRRGRWDAAAALEASASPEDRHRIDALVRLGSTWGAP